MAKAIEVHPVTPERWGDLEKLFGPSGAYGGCWCMYFRMRSSDNARERERTKGRHEGARGVGATAGAACLSER
jgi:hypothetical protein